MQHSNEPIMHLSLWFNVSATKLYRPLSILRMSGFGGLMCHQAMHQVDSMSLILWLTVTHRIILM